MSEDAHIPHTPEMVSFVDLVGGAGGMVLTSPHLIIAKKTNHPLAPPVVREVVEIDPARATEALHIYARARDIPRGWALYAVPVAGMAVA